MALDSSFSLHAGLTPFTCPNQPVLVERGVVGDYTTIIECDVMRYGGERNGIAWIAGRQAEVHQRFPGYDPSYEWIFLKWADL